MSLKATDARALEYQMCPHCGELMKPCTLTPTHDWPKPTRQVCPGSGQVPRYPWSDARPLWNGKPNPHLYDSLGSES